MVDSARDTSGEGLIQLLIRLATGTTGRIGRPFVCLVALLCAALATAAHAETARSPDVQKARDLVRLGEVRAAHRLLVDVLKKDPRDIGAHYEVGRILLSYEPPHFEQAIKHLNYAAEQQPKVSDHHLWLARAWGMKLENSNVIAAAFGPVWEVKGHFEKAVETDPKSAAARTDLFQFYLFAPGIVGGGREKALEQLRALSEVAPDSVLFHTSNAILALKDDDIDGAVLAFERIAQLSPGSAGQAFFELGMIFLAEGNYNRAQGYLKQALDSGTPIEPPHKVLGENFVRNAFYEKAKYEIENNVSVAVDSGSLTREGRISVRQESDDPRYITVLRMLGAIYEQSGRSEQALRYAARAEALTGKTGK